MNKLIKVHRIWREKKLKFYLHSISVEVPCVSTRRTTLLCIEYPLCLELRTKHGIEEKKINHKNKEIKKPKKNRMKNECEYATNYEEREYFSYMPSEWAVAAIINYHRCVVCVYSKCITFSWTLRSEQTRLNTCVSGCHCAFRHLFPLCD